MKISKDKLKKIIKEELENVMKESETDLEEAKMSDDEEKKAADILAHDKAKKGMMKQDLADKEKADKGQSTNPVASKERPMGGKPQLSGKGAGYNNPVKSAAATAKARGLAEEGLEEIKGAPARAMVGGGVNIGSAVDDARFSLDEPTTNDWGDPIPPAARDEFIDGVLQQLGIQPYSELGMDIADQISNAADKASSRSVERRDNVDRLALKKRFPPEFKKDGKMTKQSAGLQKKIAKSNLGIAENEEVQQESTEQQMEELSESFRRFTKLPKAVLKD